MNVTRLYWGGVTTAFLLVSGAVLLEQPLLLGGGVVVFVWLLAHQFHFARETRRIVQSLTVDQIPARDRAVVGEPLPVAVSVSTPRPAALDLVVDVNAPPAARCASPTAVVTLDAGTQRATGETTLVWDVAGRDRLRLPTVTVRDRSGLFVDSVRVGTERDVRVGSPRVSQVTVGRTGRELVEGSEAEASLGLTRTVQPDRVREFVAGDTTRHIDWKATARFRELFVREYEREVDRSMQLVVDTRATMAQGPVGRTKLDYVRHLSLSVCEMVASDQLPLGLTLFDEQGPTTDFRPRANTRSGQGPIRAALEDLGPHPTDDDQLDGLHAVGRSHALRSPTVVAETARALTDESAFATQLRPFFEPSRRSSRPSDVGPLYQVVQSNRAQSRGRLVTLVFTDDSHGAELADAVTAAAHDGGEVVVFLTPSVLFDLDLLADPAAAYREFVEFEEFRRALDAYDGVTVYETGPGDQLASILSNAPTARRRRPANRTSTVGGTQNGTNRLAGPTDGDETSRDETTWDTTGGVEVTND